MSINIYKLIHLVGIFGLFLACGALLTAGQKKIKWTAPIHGTALVLILISGFGLLSRLGIRGELPSWALGKLIIWVLFGLSLAIVRKKWASTPLLLGAWLLLGGTAASLALWMP